jgi:hypothetical protein
MATHPGKKPPMAVQSEPRSLEEDIRRRAYEFYEARGKEDGHDLEDWLRADKEITRNVRTIAA